MPPDPKANPALTKIDQAIAADADALLQGDFETIDAVLEGVFEEQAALVQMDDKSPAANPRAMAASRAAAAPPQAPIAPRIEAPAPPVELSIPSAAEVAATAASAQSEEFSATPAEAEFDPVAASQAEPAAPAIAQTPAIAHARDESAAPAADGGGKSKFKLAAPSLPIVPLLKRGVVGVLMIINFPLRFVPASQRPMVDWIALSLLGWVPVVWVLVLTLGHRNAHVQASPEVHEAGSVLATTPTEDKPMHEASPGHGESDAH